MDLDEIGIPGGIGKKLDAYDTPTAQVRGAKYANLMLGTNFGSGSKPKRLYIEKVHPDFWQRMEDEEGLDPQRDHLYGEFKRDPDVICFEYADQVPDEFKVDWEKMLDKTLQGGRSSASSRRSACRGRRSRRVKSRPDSAPSCDLIRSLKITFNCREKFLPILGNSTGDA